METYYVTLIIPQLHTISHSDQVKIIHYFHWNFPIIFTVPHVLLFLVEFKELYHGYCTDFVWRCPLDLKLFICIAISIEKQPSNVFTKSKVWWIVNCIRKTKKTHELHHILHIQIMYTVPRLQRLSLRLPSLFALRPSQLWLSAFRARSK